MAQANADDAANALSATGKGAPEAPDPAAVAAAEAAAAATAALYADPATAPLPQDVAKPNAFIARGACLRGIAPTESFATRNIRVLMRQGLYVQRENLPLTASRSKTRGEGAVGFQVLNEAPYTFNVAMNNAGMTTTGKMQGTANLLLNNPLGMGGRLNSTLSQDLQNARRDSTNRDLTASYTLPIDADWTVGLQGSAKASTDQMASSTSQGQSLQWRVRRAFDITANGTTGVELRYNRNRYEDASAQRSYDTFAEVGLSHQHYFGRSKLDLSVMQRFAAPWMPSSSGPPGWSYRFRSVDAKLSVPF
ncbi:activation/secretion protein [Pandoraea terrae]|uniref:Activation/secretion protein n=2 Tax=Pandoraea terrae TaxID=1537710 RepID=A0A5E4RWQ3_9BURK|nr:activation/secretion protein [Pandoraea terrae]